MVSLTFLWVTSKSPTYNNNLLVKDAPSLQFRQSDGENLCVSKALASVLNIIGFTEPAQLINQYGKSQLKGGSMHVLRKVGQFASSVLPPWIKRNFIEKVTII